jgi:predicted nucleic acid-binding protein
MIVLDTSVVIDVFMIKETALEFAELGKTEEFAVPDHFFSEVVHVLRRLERYEHITSDFGTICIVELSQLPLRSFSLRHLIQETWTLRHNISAYDAPFVVLAGELDCPLLTHDDKLANTARSYIPVKQLSRTAP